MAGVRVIDKATGQEITVSAQEARRAVLQGDALMPEGRVMIKRGTEVLTLDPSELPKAWNQGWDLTDEEEARQLKLRREETDAASTAAGAIEAAASGLTFGLSRVAEEALGVDPERMRARAEGLGAAEDVIEMGAGLAGAIATGGTGLLAKGGVSAAKAGATRALARTAGRTLGAPTGAVMRGAAAAERGLASAVGRTTLPAVVKKAIPIAGRGSVEGFAYGVGAEIDESVLGDRELSAEQLLAAGFMGAAFGGAGEVGVRMGLPAVTRSVGQLSKKGLRRVLGSATGSEQASRTAAEAVEGLVEKRLDPIWEFQGADPGVGTRMVREIHKDRRKFLRAANKHEYAAEAAEIAGKIDPHVGTMRDAYHTLARKSGSEARIGRLVDDLPADVDGVAREAAQKELATIDRELQEMWAENFDAVTGVDLGTFDKGVVRKIAQELDTARRGVLETPTGKQAYRSVETLRREIDNELNALGYYNKQKVLDRQESKTAEKLLGMRRRLSAHNKDKTIYGRLGEATEEMYADFEAVRRFEDTRGRSKYILAMFKEGAEVPPRDMLRLVRSSRPGFKGDTEMREFWQYVDLQERRMRTVLKYGELDPMERAEMARFVKASEEMKKEFGRHAETAKLHDEMATLRDVENSGSVSMGETTTVGPRVGRWMGAGVGGGLGFAVGGPVGAAIGAGLGGGVGTLAGSIISRPYTALRAYAGMSEMMERVSLRTREAVRRFATGRKAAGRAMKALAPIGRRAATIGAARAGAKRDRESRYKEARTYLAHTMANPGTLAIRMERAMSNLPDHAPKLAALMHAKAGAAAQFLAAKLPPTYVPPFSDPDDALVDPSAMDKFLRYVEVAEDPLVALERMADGTISVEHAEALRMIYPAIYGDVQRQIWEAMAEDQAKGRQWPFERKVQLGILFRQPTVTALRADAQQMIQAAHGPLEEPQALPGGRGGRKTPDLSRGRVTALSRLEEPLSDRYA